MTATRSRTRPRLREHLHVGARVISTQSLSVYRVQNLWDTDRQAQLINRDGARLTVPYGALLSEFELVQPFANQEKSR